MRKILFNIFLLIAGIGLFVWALKITDLGKVISYLNRLGPLQFLFIFIILFGGEIIIGSLRWWYILKNHGQRPPFLKTLFSKTICFGFSYMTPVVLFGGETFRYASINEEFLMPSSAVISSIAIDKLMFTITCIGSYIVGILFFLSYAPISFILKMTIFLILTLGLLIAYFIFKKLKIISKNGGLTAWFVDKFYLFQLKKIKKHQERIEDVEKNIIGVLKKRKVVFNIILLSIAEILLVITSYWFIIYYFLGGVMSLEKIMAVYGVTGLSYIIPIPAALGSLEMGQSFVFGLFGLNSYSGIAFSLIVRGMNLIISFLGGIFFLRFQIKFFKKRIINALSKFSKKIKIDEKKHK